MPCHNAGPRAKRDAEGQPSARPGHCLHGGAAAGFGLHGGHRHAGGRRRKNTRHSMCTSPTPTQSRAAAAAAKAAAAPRPPKSPTPKRARSTAQHKKGGRGLPREAPAVFQFTCCAPQGFCCRFPAVRIWFQTRRCAQSVYAAWKSRSCANRNLHTGGPA